MKVCKKQKLLFIHIPKCGGSTVNECFDLKGETRNHAAARHVRDEVPEIWNSFLTFTSIRNPWEAELSSYFYKTGDKVLGQHPDAHICAVNLGFGGFLKEGGGIRSYPFLDASEYPHSMMRFITDEDDNIMVDEIIRLERMEEDIDKMCQKHNLERTEKFEKRNSTSHLHYSHYYTEQWMIDLVYKENEDYIKHFKYEFDHSQPKPKRKNKPRWEQRVTGSPENENLSQTDSVE